MTRPLKKESTAFNSPEDRLNLFKENGRPDGAKIVHLLEYKQKDVSSATNLPKEQIHFDNRMPKELEDRLKEWAIALNLVAVFFNDNDKTIRWFDIPNPLLGGLTPKQIIKIGRFKKLRDVILTALEENNR